VITHVVLLRWKPDLPAGHAAVVAAALRALPGMIPALRDYRVGEDVALGAGNYDFGVVATFADADEWRAYQTDAEHERIKSDLIGPWVAERASIQFES
jgi:hypothetical protein